MEGLYFSFFDTGGGYKILRFRKSLIGSSYTFSFFTMNKKISFGGAFLSLFLLSACGMNPAAPNTESSLPSVKGGSYSHRQEYSVKENKFYIDVKTTLQDAKITAIEVIPDPNGKTAIKYADGFKKDVQSKIIGKTISQAKQMGYVSGASETSKAFATALNAIEKEATTK